MQMRDIDSIGRRMSWPKTGTTYHHAQLINSEKGCAIKGLVVCNGWDLALLDLLNGLS